MSEFEHIFHLIQLHGRMSREEKTNNFLQHTFALLDAWMARSDDVQQQLAFEYTQAHAPGAAISMWWFEQEQKQPQRWANSWSPEQFVQHTVKEDLLSIAPERMLARIDWARRNNQWDFFASWDMHFVRRCAQRLCHAQPDNPAVAQILDGMKTHNVDVCEALSNHIPKDYIQSHIGIIPDGETLLHQRDVIAELETYDPLKVLSCLEEYTGAVAVGSPQIKLVDYMRLFWEHNNTYDPDVLQKICDHLVALFPNYPHTIVPRLDHQSQLWQIQANMCRPNHLQWFVADKTSRMLDALTVFPNMSEWVGFWNDVIKLDNWTQEMSNAGEHLYVLKHIGPVTVSTIENNMAPHWEFFEHNAPKMGRAIASVVAFLGGNPPLSLCDFSNLFNFSFPLSKHYPEGFQQFVEAHVQRQTLNTCVDTSRAPSIARKI